MLGLQEVLDKLEKYALLEGTEIGEATNLLLNLARYTDYVNPVFADALEEELRDQLQMYKKSTTIVESEVTTTRTEKHLEWL